MRGLAWACVMAVVAACAVTNDDNNDGAYCASNDDCDSESCIGNRCTGSRCDGRTSCADGWRCQEGKKNVIGRAPSQCVPTCSGCPVEYSCKAGESACSHDPISITIAEPAAETILRRGEPVRVRAIVSKTVDATFVSWSLGSKVAAEGADTTVTPPAAGEVKLSAGVSLFAQTAPAAATAEATYRVCEPQRGIGCNLEWECCAPLKCSDSGFGKKSCL